MKSATITQFSGNARRRQIVACAAERHATVCRACGETVDLVTFAEAGEIVGASADEIIVRAAGGAVHIIIHREALLVCARSLLAAKWQSKTVCLEQAQRSLKINC